MKVSIIIPFYNEEENVRETLHETRLSHPHAEIIAIDDGSNDRTRELIGYHADVRLVSLPSNMGQSAAFYAGLSEATGDICVTMDGDGQNDPRDISTLLERLDGYDAAFGYRHVRQESYKRRMASRLGNAIRRFFLHDTARDSCCSLKAIRKEHLRHLVFWNGFHRYIPSMLQNAGLTTVEVPVNDRPRRAGTSKYTIAGRAWRGLRDLIGMHWFLSRQIVIPAKR